MRPALLCQRRFSTALYLGTYSMGCVLPFLATCVWLKVAGVFPQFWFWTISYAREYAAILPFAQGSTYLFAMLARAIETSLLLCLGAAFGLALLCSVRMTLGRRLFLLGFLAFSVLSVCPGYYFRPHYFILLLPAVALLIGLAVAWSEEWFEPTPWLRLAPLIIAVVACATSLLAYHNILFKLSPDAAVGAVYPDRPFAESLDIARYIQEHTTPGDRIAVIGSEPEIYFYAHRRSSTGYIYTYPLVEPQPFAKKMLAEMIGEIERNPPAYLVFVSVPSSLSSARYYQGEARRSLVAWVHDYTAKNMHAVGWIRLTGPGASEAVWLSEAAGTSPQSSSYIAIYESRQHHSTATAAGGNRD